jgi:hypothetical protein
MRLRTILFSLLLVVYLGLLPGRSSAIAAPAQGALNLPASGSGWQTTTIDSGPSGNGGISLAIHPPTQRPYISYYDGVNKDLKIAFPVGAGGAAALAIPGPAAHSPMRTRMILEPLARWILTAPGTGASAISATPPLPP